MGELFERLGLGDEVGLAAQIDEDADASAVDVAVDQALASSALGALGGGGDALLTQDEPCLLHVAVGFGQRLPAVHDAGAGLGAEFFDLVNRYGHVGRSSGGMCCWLGLSR